METALKRLTEMSSTGVSYSLIPVAVECQCPCGTPPLSRICWLTGHRTRLGLNFSYSHQVSSSSLFESWTRCSCNTMVTVPASAGPPHGQGWRQWEKEASSSMFPALLTFSSTGLTIRCKMYFYPSFQNVLFFMTTMLSISCILVPFPWLNPVIRSEWYITTLSVLISLLALDFLSYELSGELSD